MNVRYKFMKSLLPRTELDAEQYQRNTLTRWPRKTENIYFLRETKNMESRSIPLCLPDNCSWNECTNEYKKQGVSRSTLKVIDAALRRLKNIHGPVCVVAIAGPCRKGKSYILAKLFTDEEIFPLGHLLDPETMGLWMYVVKEKFKDANGEEFTVVLIDSEGTDSVLAQGRDDDVIFTLTVLLSNILIYNSSSVPKRSDLEGLDHMLKLCQRIQVLSGKMTTSKQAQTVFPSFVWLLRDVMLQLPQDCKDINEYFHKRIFNPELSKTGDKAQKVADTILKCFPNFEAFALPLPSFDPNVVQNLSEERNRGSVNRKFSEGVKEFTEIVKQKLEPKKTPDGKGFFTGEVLASMVETYIKTLNTPGAVPSIAGAWDIFITQKRDELLNIAKVFYYHEMKDDIEWRLPCDSAKIREIHAMVLDHVIKSVFGSEAKEIPEEILQQYLSELTAEAEDTESSWLQQNNRLTEENCDTLFRELKDNVLKPVKSIWMECENAGFAEERIRSAYEEVMKKFKRQCRGCGELIMNYAMFYKEELDKEMREEIQLVRQLGAKRDEITAYQVMIEDQKDETQRTGVENEQIKERLRQIEEQMEELTLQSHQEYQDIFDEMNRKLLEQREELQSKMRENETKARMDMDGIESMTQTLHRHQQELRRAIEERDETIRRLRQQTR